MKRRASPATGGARRRPLLCALLAAAFAGGCADATGPDAPDGVALQLSVTGPERVSAAETEALGEAFDRVDRYITEVSDSATLETITVDTIAVPAGSSAHALDVVVPASVIGRTVSITLRAYAGTVELYRSTVITRVTDEVGSAVRVGAEIRYTGPGVRGTVRSDAGDPVAGVTVRLFEDGEIPVDSAVTEGDGTYVFVGLANGDYTVTASIPLDVAICPSVREVRIASATDVFTADFRTQPGPCGTRVLVVSGGDFDDTGVVATLLDGDPQLVADTTFFFVSELPTLDFLSGFDVVLLFMNGLFDESPALGGRIAEYVDAGGNLVVASFYFQGRTDAGTGSLGWGALETIDPFTAAGGGATYTEVSLGTVLDPAHPIMAGIAELSSLSYSSGVEARSGTTVIAQWSDGDPLVGFRSGPAGQRIVGVSLFPGATTSVAGDVQALWRNVARWAGEVGGPG